MKIIKELKKKTKNNTKIVKLFKQGKLYMVSHYESNPGNLSLPNKLTWFQSEKAAIEDFKMEEALL